MQSSVDFATVPVKLLPNVKIIHFDEAEIQSPIRKLGPWNIVCETSGISNYHAASCTGPVIKMWHTTMEMHETPATPVVLNRAFGAQRGRAFSNLEPR